MICEKCKREMKDLNDEQIKKRLDLHISKDLCPQCFRIVKKRLKDNFPESLLYLGNKSNPIPYNLYLQHYDLFSNSSKNYVSFLCECCKEIKTKRICKMRHAKIAKDKCVCRECMPYYISNSKEWRKHNQEAQLKTQCQNTVKKKIRNSIEELIEKDSYFGLKRTFGKSKTLRGFYKGIYFSSGFELSYLYENRESNLSNCTFYITYQKNGKTHFYYPDFIVNGDIIEIKGRQGKDCKEKFLAGEQYAKQHNCKYYVYFKKDIHMIFSNSNDLDIIPEEDLIIIHYPPNWEINHFYYKNKQWVKQLYEKIDLNNKESTLKYLEFFLTEKKIFEKFKKLKPYRFKEECQKILDSPLFIIFYIFDKIKKGEITFE